MRDGNDNYGRCLFLLGPNSAATDMGGGLGSTAASTEASSGPGLTSTVTEVSGGALTADSHFLYPSMTSEANLQMDIEAYRIGYAASRAFRIYSSGCTDCHRWLTCVQRLCARRSDKLFLFSLL